MSKGKQETAVQRRVQAWPIPPGETEGVPTFRAPPSFAELLAWFDASASKPDADILQLLWIADADGHCDWDAGWWSGEEWLLAESGGSVSGTVRFFASPEGPSWILSGRVAKVVAR